MLSYANIRHEFVSNFCSSVDQSDNDVGYFFEDAEVAGRYTVEGERNAVMKLSPNLRDQTAKVISDLRAVQFC